MVGGSRWRQAERVGHIWRRLSLHEKVPAGRRGHSFSEILRAARVRCGPRDTLRSGCREGDFLAASLAAIRTKQHVCCGHTCPGGDGRTSSGGGIG